MNGNGDQAQSLEGLQAALTARATMQGWAEGMELIELVGAVYRAGWLDKLHDRISAGDQGSAPIERLGGSVVRVSAPLTCDVDAQCCPIVACLREMESECAHAGIRVAETLDERGACRFA